MNPHERGLLRDCFHTLVFSMVSIIDFGEKRNIREIEKHIEEKNIITYLINEFSSKEGVDFTGLEEHIFKEISLEEYIYENSRGLYGVEDKVFCVRKEENGLLLFLALCYELQNDLYRNNKVEIKSDN